MAFGDKQYFVMVRGETLWNYQEETLWPQNIIALISEFTYRKVLEIENRKFILLRSIYYQNANNYIGFMIFRLRIYILKKSEFGLV